MRPVLFEIDLPLVGHVAFPSYLTLIVVGFLVAVIGARRAARPAGIDGDRLVDMAVVCLVAGLAGARLLAVLTDGRLTDFVVWKWYTHEWPTFNVADAALCVGVGLLFLDLGRQQRDEKKKAD